MVLIKTLLSLFISLAVIGAVGFFLWVILQSGWDAYKSLSEGVQVALAAGLITIVTTAVSLVYTRIKDRKLQIEANNNKHKQKLYSDFTGGILDMVADPELGEDDAWTQEMRLNFMKNAFLWSDPRVLTAYRNLRINTQEIGGGEQAMHDIARLFLEFRKDLGLRNRKITEHTIADILYDQTDLKEFYEKFPRKK